MITLYWLAYLNIKSNEFKEPHVLNAAASLIHRCPRFSHITPVLIALHWLPVKYRVELKIALLVYKALNNMAPIYISELLIPKPSSDRWTLRSDDQGLLHIPKTNCKTLGDRSFAHAAPGTVITFQSLRNVRKHYFLV